MKVEVMNRSTAEARSEIERHEDKIVISIYTPTDTPAAIDRNNPTIIDVLQLAFVDSDDTDKDRFDWTWIFSYQQAYKIFKFIEKWKDKVDRIWIHCDGGVSRSAGVGAAILKAYTNDDSQIFGNPNYYPNMLVYRRTLKVLTDELSKIRSQD